MYTDYKSLPLALTVEQAAEVLHISRNTAYELIRSGAIHSVKVGKRQYRIPKDAIKKYMTD